MTNINSSTTSESIATALRRVEAALKRHPELGVHDDAPATARWQHGTRIVSSHANGTQIETDMPAELGGSGDRVTPGWLFRAGLASCAATSIELAAVAEGIELEALEVHAGSRSDARGLIGLPDRAGQPVGAGPFDLQLQVRIAAAGVEPQRLRRLVEDGLRRSPIPNVVTDATAMAVQVEVDDKVIAGH